MASETEGIALLSMYGDDEEDEEAPGSAAKLEAVAAAPAEEDDGGEYSEELLKANHYKSEQLQQAVSVKSPLSLTSPSPVRSFDGSEFKTLRSPFLHQTPTPQPPVLWSQLSSPLSLTPTSPITAPVPPSAAQGYSEGQRARKTALAIVDYAQDETAMSPEAEFMEVEAYGLVVLGAEFVSDWNTEVTAPVTSQSLTPTSQQERLLPVDFHKQSKFESSVTMNFNVTESEAGIVEASSTVSTDMQIDNLMLNFLPPAVSTKCPEVLQEKINKFLAYKRAGKSFNADLRNRKDYRNPNFLQHAVSYQDIDEIGTCFSKEVFDPHGYDKCDYYDELEADLKRELERKEQERKKSQKIEFVSGCTQTSGAAPALKTNTHNPSGSSLLSSSLPPNPATGDTAKESRINKKSKWDKVDGEPKIPLPSGGHDNQHSASVNASHLSAANAGTGYSAFAQLKRREAEERKSSDKKFDKRSS